MFKYIIRKLIDVVEGVENKSTNLIVNLVLIYMTGGDFYTYVYTTLGLDIFIDFKKVLKNIVNLSIFYTRMF